MRKPNFVVHLDNTHVLNISTTINVMLCLEKIRYTAQETLINTKGYSHLQLIISAPKLIVVHALIGAHIPLL